MNKRRLARNPMWSAGCSQADVASATLATYASVMFGAIARVTAKSGQLDELVAFLAWDAEVCRHEAGTLRFDVWLDPATPDSVILYEAYVDVDAFKAHQAAEPFQKFVDEIVPNLVDSVSFIVPFGTSTSTNAVPSSP